MKKKLWDMSNGSSRKSSRRNKPDTEGKSLYTNYQPEIVEVERNVLEQWLLDLKHWAQQNRTLVRYSLLSLVALFFFFLLYIFVADQREKKHSEQLYHLIANLEQSNEILSQSEDLCYTWWSTPSSQNACLVLAILQERSQNFSAMSESLKKFNRFWNKKNFLPVTLFYQALSYEAQEDYTTAYKTLEQLEKLLYKSTYVDIALFHRARILYRQKKWDLAQQAFERLLKDHKSSMYVQDSEKYLILLAAQRQFQNDKTR